MFKTTAVNYRLADTPMVITDTQLLRREAGSLVKTPAIAECADTSWGPKVMFLILLSLQQTIWIKLLCRLGIEIILSGFPG